jgi:LSD1 subclass zinc finger protein
VNRLALATECPSCAGPLEFPAGSTAVRCSHCGSELLVTGRTRVLSYAVSARVDAGAAIHSARSVWRQDARVLDQRLYFIPYYRFTAHEFQWRRAPAPDPPRAGDPFLHEVEPVEELGTLGELVRGFVGRSPVPKMLWSLTVGRPPSARPVQPGPRADLAPAVFHDRYVDRSFLAAAVPDFGVPSLGLRTQVIRAGLFRADALSAQGAIVGVGVSAEAALAEGMRVVEEEWIIRREVIGRVLSIIYVPFWVVRLASQGRERLVVVDAIAESVASSDAPAGLLEALGHPPTGPVETVGFRPLVCPQCGGDLPVRPDDVVFACAGCGRAWEIAGSELHGVASEVVDAPAEIRRKLKYLPFWVLRSASGDGGPRFFLPAFRFQRLKFLGDLARNLLKAQPRYAVSGEERPELHGCYYDLNDARALAAFVEHAPGAPGVPEPTLSAATLTYMPFSIEGRSLVEPFTRTELPASLLL